MIKNLIHSTKQRYSAIKLVGEEKKGMNKKAAIEQR
jgi:hypothetical protein